MEKRHTQKSSASTSWHEVHRWYDDLVGESGHHYHQSLILPQALRLLDLKPASHLLDLACGQGILSRKIPKKTEYVGLDISPELIKAAKQYLPEEASHRFIVHDVTKPLPLAKESKFSHAACILAIQNIEEPAKVFANIRPFLHPGAKFLIVMNHPAFRIPRQSSWGFDEATKIQYRKINGYMTAQKIPIQMHPGKGSVTTISFHYPLSAYSKWLKENGFTIDVIEELCSDKVSTGGAAKWENRARREFPLFLTILATLS